MPADFFDTISSTPTTNVAITPVTTYLDLEGDDSDDEDEEIFMPSHLRSKGEEALMFFHDVIIC